MSTVAKTRSTVKKQRQKHRLRQEEEVGAQEEMFVGLLSMEETAEAAVLMGR